MTIYKEFKQRLDRTLQRAQTTAQGSTLNKEAWQKQVEDLAVMRRLLDEGLAFLAGTEARAESRYSNAREQEELDVDQVEDLASAKTIADNLDLFNSKDVGTVKVVLELVDPPVFAEAWKRLPEKRQEELTNAI